MSNEKETEQKPPIDKLLVNFDNDLLSKLFEADSRQARVELLGPVAAAIMWDSGQISNAGMSREAHERYMALKEKIVEQLGEVDFIGLSPEQVDEIAREKGVRNEVLEAQQIWKDTEKDRILVRQYIEEKKKLKEEKDASQ
jgi:hypothetical protein